VVALVALVAWIAGLAGAIVGTRIAANQSAPARTPSTLGLVEAEPRTEPLPPMDVLAAASVIGPSIVSIDVISEVNDGLLRGSGTGIVLTADGEIVTNAHVIDGADTVSVRLPGETEPRRATVVSSDVGRDLALLRIDADGLQPATFAAAGDIRLGDPVLAVGFALALDGDPSVTQGIVSALDRTSADDVRALKGLIQTDTPISSGNSGGPLVNSLGQVVGVVTFVATGENGSQANDLGFAISNQELLPAIDRLRAQAGGDAPASGFLGVQLEQRLDGGSGALVTEVVPDSGADAAGIRVGDVVVAVDGVDITGQAGLVATIRDLEPGDEVTVRLVRDGDELTVTANLGERPAD
jgi:putative serine protease PepD